ncbi:MAG: PA14 domain-containing protein, partial [Nitrospirota bacterium]|nr:PA14 domain-containing protein [Nitrospirota bacterium]
MIAYFVDKLPGTELTGDLVPDIDTVLPDPFYNFPEYNDNTHSANFRAGNLPPDNDPAYSAHLWGWVTIPETGDYTWHVTSDDNSSLYIADTMDEIIANYGGTILENPTMVCSVDGWSGFTAWNGNAPGTNGNTANPTRGKQTSDVFTYTAGQTLAFYVTHDEGTLGDHLNVAWTPPGGNAPDNASLSEALTNIPPALERAFGANPA